MFQITITRMVCLTTIVLCGWPPNQVDAQYPSLWQRRSQRMTNPIADVKAQRPGDLLFITIREQSDVENKDLRTLNKSGNSSTEATGSYAVASAAANGTVNQESASNRRFNANTQFKSEREFLDRMAVSVVDTLPNGNLLISGTRNVSLEGDNRKLILTGLVRSVDVTRDNTISSQMISNLVIRYAADPNQSAEAKFINQGWLGKKLNKFWPH